MTKAELIEAILNHDDSISKKTIDNVLNHLATVIHQELANGGEVTLPGLIKLSVTERAARQGRNPRTGAVVDIPAKRVPKMKALKALKDGIV
ncbi:MAG: HU family DNA-binding protein [Methylomarinum sp.]|nr:HU family DNA-binding protein [Methylomarinum sp.]